MDEGGAVLGMAKAPVVWSILLRRGGVGRALCEYTLEWAHTAGFGTRRFNAVARTNTRAAGLYESLCFEVLGTLPEGFAPPVYGYVGLHIMYRRL